MERPPFLVTLSTQRSGTKFLGTAMSAGRVARSLGEVFQPGSNNPLVDFRTHLAEFVARGGGFGFEAEEMRALLDGYVARLAARVAPALLHFDVMYNNLGCFAPVWSFPQASPQGNFLMAWLRARGAGVIHLVRDVTECFASHVIAEARGVYHTGNPADDARGLSLALSAEQAAQYMLPILRARRFVQRAFAGYGRFVELGYGELVAGQTVPPATALRLARGVGLRVEEAPALFGASPLRATASDKRALVGNYDDIARLAGALEAQLEA